MWPLFFVSQSGLMVDPQSRVFKSRFLKEGVHHEQQKK